jgi:hypothetical protein
MEYLLHLQPFLYIELYLVELPNSNNSRLEIGGGEVHSVAWYNV